MTARLESADQSWTGWSTDSNQFEQPGCQKTGLNWRGQLVGQKFGLNWFELRLWQQEDWLSTDWLTGLGKVVLTVTVLQVPEVNIY